MTRIQLRGIYHWNITQDIASISDFKLDFIMMTKPICDGHKPICSRLIRRNAKADSSSSVSHANHFEF